MKKTYVTFGQTHTHSVNGITLDKNTVAVLSAENREHGRQKAFDYFGAKFCFEYFDDQWNDDDIKYYPAGYVYID